MSCKVKPGYLFYYVNICFSGSVQRPETKCHSDNAICNGSFTNWCSTSLLLTWKIQISKSFACDQYLLTKLIHVNCAKLEKIIERILPSCFLLWSFFFSKRRAALSCTTEGKQRGDADNRVKRGWEKSTLVLFYVSEHFQHKILSCRNLFFPPYYLNKFGSTFKILFQVFLFYQSFLSRKWNQSQVCTTKRIHNFLH